MSNISRTLIVTACALVLAAPASAGIADSPLPILEAGKTTFHLYSVPGVIDGGYLATFFVCTSTDTAPQKVSVETFGPGCGPNPCNDAAADSVNLSPGLTVNFGTQFPTNDILGFVGAQRVSANPGTGSARILSTSKKLVCTAFVGDWFNVPATGPSWQLTIIAKTKQKAAN